jgi:hypothetical protein
VSRPAIDGLAHCASIEVGREAHPAAMKAAATETRKTEMRAITEDPLELASVQPSTGTAY